MLSVGVDDRDNHFGGLLLHPLQNAFEFVVTSVSQDVCFDCFH